MKILNEPLYQQFLDFVVERQAIYIRKESGAPPPWTDDPTLRRARINNVFRRQDRFTKQELAEIDGEPFAEQVRRILILRHSIDADVYWAAAKNGWRLKADDPALDNYSSSVLPMRTGVLTERGAVAQHLACVADRFAQVAFLLAISQTPKQCTGLIRDAFPLLDPFRVYEVFTSLTYCEDFQWSENDHLYVGHGSTAITHGLLGQELTDLDDARALAWKAERDLDAQGFQRDRQFSVRALEDSFCEFRKYLESRAGGRPHRVYTPRA